MNYITTDEIKDFIRFLKKFFKSLIYTIFALIFTVCGIYGLVNFTFGNMSVEQDSTWIIICMCIGIMFVMFFCTFTIIEEVRRKSNAQS